MNQNDYSTLTLYEIGSAINFFQMKKYAEQFDCVLAPTKAKGQEGEHDFPALSPVVSRADAGGISPIGGSRTQLSG